MDHGRYRRIVFFLATAGLFALLMVTPTLQSIRAAGPRYVAPGGTDSSNDCTNISSPCVTIQHAVDEADPGDMIYVATGTYTSTASEVVLLNKDIVLSGGWDATFITQSGTSTVDGQYIRPGITVSSGVNATIDHFVIQNGSSNGGGGIYSEGTLTLDNSTVSRNVAYGTGGGIRSTGDLTLNNSTVSDNRASYDLGGGIYIWRGTLTLNSSTISSNTASRGGGICSLNGAVALDNSIVSDNTAYEGGGIDGGSYVTITNSIVSGNRAGIRGGGISGFSTLVLDQSTVSGNSASQGDGGGIYWGGTGIATLTNSTISGNRASAGGGGVYNSHGNALTLDNSTISGNTAHAGGGINVGSGTANLNNSTVSGNIANDGGGIAKDRYYGTVTLRNTILAGNTAANAPDCRYTIGTEGYNLIGDASGCTFTPSTGDLTGVSASLGRLIGPTGSPRYHPLLSGSPAINAGNPAGCTGSSGPLLTDQRGAARVGRCDIGAYEYTIPGPAANVYAFDGTPQRTPPNSVFWLPLQVLVLDSIGSPVDDITVTFSAPTSEASGTFADSETLTTTTTTDVSGIATAATFTANGLEGSYTVTATASGVVTPASFSLSNFGWYVASTGNDADDCQTPTTACATINGPLGKTEFIAGDMVLVAAGTYTGAGSEVVLIDKNVRISGGWNNAFTMQNSASIIDGEDERPGITVDIWVTAIVEYLVIQKGDNWRGGGIQNNGVLTLSRVTVRDSLSSQGGGLHNSGILVLNASTVSGNRATEGGGVYNSGGTLNLNNSTVSNNVGSGGIHNEGTAILQNTILAGNTLNSGTDSDCSGDIDSLGYNLIGNTSYCTFSAGADDLLDVDPKLFPLIGSPGYHPLLPGSPAIDAGNPAGCTDHLGNPLNADLRGVARVGRCDIGAYEFDPTNNPLTHVFLPLVIRNN